MAGICYYYVSTHVPCDTCRVSARLYIFIGQRDYVSFCSASWLVNSSIVYSVVFQSRAEGRCRSNCCLDVPGECLCNSHCCVAFVEGSQAGSVYGWSP